MLPVTVLLVDEWRILPLNRRRSLGGSSSWGLSTSKRRRRLSPRFTTTPQWLTALKWVGVIALVVGFVVFCLYYGGFISRWLGVPVSEAQTEAS